MSRFMSILRTAWYYVAVAVAALAIGLTGLLKMPIVQQDQYRPSFSPPQEHDILLAYIGSSTCGFANDPALPEVIERAKLAL